MGYSLIRIFCAVRFPIDVDNSICFLGELIGSKGTEEPHKESHMPVLLRGATDTVVVEAPFVNEAELQRVLADTPSLLTRPAEDALSLVARELDLPDAGNLDLLFVDANGLPTAVEVKLARNRESRRQVIAQIIDYVSSLTLLTVDELDSRVDGALEAALRSFDVERDDKTFERRWQAAGANLRAGLARVALVLDDAPDDLARIVRFLADHSNFDLRLITVTKYSSGPMGSLYVPGFLVTRDLVGQSGTGPRPLLPKLGAIVAAYDSGALPDLKTIGTASNYRQIRPPEWPIRARVHYEFIQAGGQIGVELHLENPLAASLAPQLATLAGSLPGSPNSTLIWDPKWSRGSGRLRVLFHEDAPPTEVAEAMTALIEFTRDRVTNALNGGTAPSAA